jgi:hypothetical protein
MLTYLLSLSPQSLQVPIAVAVSVPVIRFIVASRTLREGGQRRESLASPHPYCGPKKPLLHLANNRDSLMWYRLVIMRPTCDRILGLVRTLGDRVEPCVLADTTKQAELGPGPAFLALAGRFSRPETEQHRPREEQSNRKTGEGFCMTSYAFFHLGTLSYE